MIIKGRTFAFLIVASTWLVTAGLVFGGGQGEAKSATQGPVKMSFVAWSYGVQTVQDNIKNFEAMNPNVSITFQDYSWLQYHDTLVGRFAAGDFPDLLYGSDAWLREWASAGWLAPLDKYFPQVKNYSPELASYALDGMTYDNHVYGMSYYADILDFIYNSAQLKKAGFSSPPQTLNDVWNMSVTLKNKGIVKYPIIFAWSQQEGAFPEALESLVAAQQQGGRVVFDNNLTPVFNRSGSAFGKVLTWVRNAYKTGLIDPVSLSTAEIDQIKSMQAGEHTFTIAPQYNMAELNKPGSGQYAGKFRIALMPGVSHETVGYVRFYAMTPAVPKKGKNYLNAAWKFFQYFAGKTNGQYIVVKRWAVQNGLGFAQLPLFKDPDVQAAWGKWGHMDTILAQEKLARPTEGMTTWYQSWWVYSAAEIQRSILGQESVGTALSNMAAKWNSLKASG